MKTRAESLDADLDLLRGAFSEISRLTAEVSSESNTESHGGSVRSPVSKWRLDQSSYDEGQPGIIPMWSSIASQCRNKNVRAGFAQKAIILVLDQVELVLTSATEAYSRRIRFKHNFLAGKLSHIQFWLNRRLYWVQRVKNRLLNILSRRTSSPGR